MIFIQALLAFFIIYLCVYALISRICKCVEHCATAKAYSKFKENGVMIKFDDVAAGIMKSNMEKENVEKSCGEKS